jgi:hypothetical protein
MTVKSCAGEMWPKNAGWAWARYGTGGSITRCGTWLWKPPGSTRLEDEDEDEKGLSLSHRERLLLRAKPGEGCSQEAGWRETCGNEAGEREAISVSPRVTLSGYHPSPEKLEAMEPVAAKLGFPADRIEVTHIDKRVMIGRRESGYLGAYNATHRRLTIDAKNAFASLRDSLAGAIAHETVALTPRRRLDDEDHEEFNDEEDNSASPDLE